MNKRIPLLILSLLSLVWTLSAQEAVVNSGDNGNGSGGKVNYTVGLPEYTTVSSTNFTVSPGVRQSYEIIVLSEPAIKLSLDVLRKS